MRFVSSRSTSRTRGIERFGPAAVVVALAVQAFASGLFALLSARWLDAADRGVVVLLATTSTLLMLIGSLGVPTGGRFLLGSAPPKLSVETYVKLSTVLAVAHVLTSATVGILVLHVTGGLVTPWVGAAFVALACLNLTAYFQREALHGVGAHLSAIAGDILASVVQVAGTVALWQFATVTLDRISLLLVAAALTQVLVLSLRFRRGAVAVGGEPSRELSAKETVAHSVPAMVATLGQAFVLRGDRLLLGFFSSASSVGVYGVAATLTEILWLVPNGVAQVSFRRSSQQGRPVSGMQSYGLPLLFTAASAVALGLMAPAFLDTFLGADYRDAGMLVLILAVAAIPMASYQMDSAVLNGAGKLRAVGMLTLGGAVTLAVMSVALMPRFGAFGGAFASIFAYLAMAVPARLLVLKSQSAPPCPPLSEEQARV
jgi:O-antigen/teichoic acid export membrane protein